MGADQKQRRIAAREQRIIHELGKLVASDLDIYEVENPDGIFPPSATSVVSDVVHREKVDNELSNRNSDRVSGDLVLDDKP